MAIARKVKGESGHGRYAVTGAGVIHVRSSEILKTQQAQDQIAALKEISVVDRKKESKAG